jgi:hypothetical protein
MGRAKEGVKGKGVKGKGGEGKANVRIDRGKKLRMDSAMNSGFSHE